MKDRRLVLVFVLGAIIALVCVARVVINRPQTYEEQVAAAAVMRPAPGFEALDSEGHLVRLATWLGRHRMILVFFDGEAGADNDADLLKLRDRFAELQTQDVKVIGVTASIPQVNRAAMERAGGHFPFPLVSDVDFQSPEGTLRIHRHWGRIDPATEQPMKGIYFIDRKGQVAYVGTVPKPYDSVDAIFALLAKTGN
jgi:peroxiredoxin